jgi:hypothetical protein
MVFAFQMVRSVFFKRYAGITALLRAIVHETVLTYVAYISIRLVLPSRLGHLRGDPVFWRRPHYGLGEDSLFSSYILGGTWVISVPNGDAEQMAVVSVADKGAPGPLHIL